MVENLVKEMTLLLAIRKESFRTVRRQQERIIADRRIMTGKEERCSFVLRGLFHKGVDRSVQARGVEVNAHW
jgi:hypothetical protein